jgi:dihydroorotase
MFRITITKPDDWHIHLRDGDMLGRTVNDVAAWANRACDHAQSESARPHSG